MSEFDFGDFENIDEYIEELFEEAYGDEMEEWDDFEFWEHWSDFIDDFYDEFADAYEDTAG